MAQIDDFKANLIGGGYRTNQFRVTITPPPGISIGLDVRRTSFLCKGTTLPAITIAPLPISYRGRQIQIAGDRDTSGTWDTEFYMDTDFMIMNALQRWSNGINNMTDGEGLTNPADYKVDAFVDQLDRNGATIKSYTLRGAYPIDVAAIELDYGNNDTIEEFQVTFNYQYFESNTTT